MQQVNCPFILNGIHFFFNHIRACCANTDGPIFMNNYKGEEIDWETLTKERIELRDKFLQGEILESCKNCFQLDSFKADTEIHNSTQIDKVYIAHWLHCNCDCSYCHKNCLIDNKFDKTIKKSEYYDVFPILKQMIEKEILSKHSSIFILGGEPTVLKELDDILELLLSYVERKITIFSSGITYNKTIGKCFEQNKCELVTSIDAGTKETFEKIKRVPCFDKFKETIIRYVASAPNANENIILKYILLKDVNDNIEEIENWLVLTKELNVKNIRLDVDCNRNFEEEANNIPQHYYDIYNHVKNRAKELDLNIVFSEQISKILEKGYVF